MARRAVLGLAAFASALGRAWLPADHAATLLLGIFVLGFWVLAAMGVGSRVARRLEPEDRGATLVLRTALHAFGFVVVLMTVAGWLGGMRTVPLTLGSAVAFALSGPPRLAGVGGFDPGELWRAARARPVVALVVALATTIFAVDVAWAGLLSADYLDDASYHLPDILQWAQEGRFGYWFQCFGNHSAAYYPKATELVFAWVYLPLGELGAAKLIQGPLLGFGVLAVYALLRELGASRRAGTLAACLAATRPGPLRELPSYYVDVMFAALFVAAILMLLRLRRRPSSGRAYELLLVVGAFFGTKVLGVLMTALVLVPVAILLLAPVAKRLVAHGGARRGLLAGMAVLFVTGGWWYVRNELWSGNPLFPLIVEVGGVELFDGAYDRSDLPSSSPSAIAQLFYPSRGQGLTRFLPSLAFVFAAFGILDALRRPRRAGPAILTGIVLPGWIGLVYLGFCPWPYSRFLMAMAHLACASLVPAFDGRRRIARAAEVAVLVSIACIALPLVPAFDGFLPRTHRSVEVTPTVLAGMAVGTGVQLALAALVLLRLSPLAARVSRVSMLVLAFTLVPLVVRASDPAGPHAAERERALWRPYVFIEEHYGPSRVAFTGSITFLQPYGWKGLNRVRYVHVDDGPETFHERARELAAQRATLRGDRTGFGYYRAEADPAAWRRNLRVFDAELLVCVRLPPWIRAKPAYRVAKGGFPLERSWADSDPETFELVYEDAETRVYEIEQP